MNRGDMCHVWHPKWGGWYLARIRRLKRDGRIEVRLANYRPGKLVVSRTHLKPYGFGIEEAESHATTF